MVFATTLRALRVELLVTRRPATIARLRCRAVKKTVTEQYEIESVLLYILQSKVYARVGQNSNYCS